MRACARAGEGRKSAALIYGGRSPEHEVSVRSAQNSQIGIAENEDNLIFIKIEKDGRWYLADEISLAAPPESGRLCIVPGSGIHLLATGEKLEITLAYLLVHGTSCEDGELQGVLESCNVPYTGSGLLSSAISMSKQRAKDSLQSIVDVVPGRCFSSCPAPENLNDLRFPLIVKPEASGSSVGISVLQSDDKALIAKAFDNARRFSPMVLFEHAVNPCREFECGILVQEGAIRPLRICELRRKSLFITYDEKYITDTAYLSSPAGISPQMETMIQDKAIEIFKALGCSAYGRIDFLYDDEAKVLYMNEVTTLPGMTSASHYPRMLRASGISDGEFWRCIRNASLNAGSLRR